MEGSNWIQRTDALWRRRSTRLERFGRSDYRYPRYRYRSPPRDTGEGWSFACRRAPGGTRTHTARFLRPLPLPLGYGGGFRFPPCARRLAACGNARCSAASMPPPFRETGWGPVRRSAVGVVGLADV